MIKSKFPFNEIKFDFKHDRKVAEQLIREKIAPACEAAGYRWSKGNWWFKDLSWCRKRCSLGLTTVGKVKQPNALGGATIFLEKMHSVFRRDDDEPLSDQSGTIGAPIYAIDERLNSDSGHFNSLDHLQEEVLPLFERAISECVLPELERYRIEDDLLQALLAPDWLESVKLFATPDRRGALVTLMLAKREGIQPAIKWGRAEVERIRAEKPLITSTARYQELLRAIAYLEQQE